MPNTGLQHACVQYRKEFDLNHISRRRDGRVAEGARLESVFTRKGNVGSNPTLSAILIIQPDRFLGRGTPSKESKTSPRCGPSVELKCLSAPPRVCAVCGRGN